MSLSAYLPRDDRRTVSPSSSSMAFIENVIRNKNWVVRETGGKITVFYWAEGNDFWFEVHVLRGSKNQEFMNLKTLERSQLHFQVLSHLLTLLIIHFGRAGRWETLNEVAYICSRDFSQVPYRMFPVRSQSCTPRSCIRTYWDSIGFSFTILPEIAIPNQDPKGSSAEFFLACYWSY